MMNSRLKEMTSPRPTNPRLRGKIPHAEWPLIAERFAHGETLTEIARSYKCTAPAIRYIVKRQPGPEKGARKDRVEPRADLPGERFLSVHGSSRATAGDILHAAKGVSRDERVAETFWARVNSDIASFLAAMDAMITEENDETQAGLLEAADRLLRVSALTRLEIERARGGRKRPLRIV